MQTENFSINLPELNGIKIWEVEDVPHPNFVKDNVAHYIGQKYVEQLMKAVNSKILKEKEDRFLDPLFLIFERSMEEGVEDVGKILWDERSYYTNISWTGYSWKLPQELLRRMVDIEFRTVDDDDFLGKISIPFKKIASDGGSIMISSRLFSSMRLKVGNELKIKMKLSEKIK